MPHNVQKLLEAYALYIKLLETELDEVVPIAHSHGWKSKQCDIGKKCRADITALRIGLNPDDRCEWADTKCSCGEAAFAYQATARGWDYALVCTNNSTCPAFGKVFYCTDQNIPDKIEPEAWTESKEGTKARVIGENGPPPTEKPVPPPAPPFAPVHTANCPSRSGAPVCTCAHLRRYG